MVLIIVIQISLKHFKNIELNQSILNISSSVWMMFTEYYLSLKMYTTIHSIKSI